MKVAITIAHADPAYVERRGGPAMLSYLRGAEDRLAHRRRSLDSAHDLFVSAEGDNDQPSPAVGGKGLLVLQRSLFAAEDLGLLLHAFRGLDPWERLRRANIPELDAAYLRALEDPERCLQESYRLPSVNTLEAEARGFDEVRALRTLRAAATERWGRMLERAAHLWLNHRHVAKATLHGFPVVAGEHVDGPPGAGVLGAHIRAPKVRYAVAVTSQVQGREITTTPTVVRLDGEAVAGYRRQGRTAINLALELCEAQASSIASGHATSLPLRARSRLDADAQAALSALLGEEPS